jgi:hypothetical protein
LNLLYADLLWLYRSIWLADDSDQFFMTAAIHGLMASAAPPAA